MEKEILVICISGGLDSFTMYHYANKVFNKDNRYNIKYLVVVDADSPYCGKEGEAITQLYAGETRILPKEFNVVTINGYGNLAKMEDHVVLGRNAVIASIASALGGNIWMGGTEFENNSEMFDKNFLFWNKMSNALNHACKYKREHTQVDSPFQGLYQNWDKVEMIIWLETQGIFNWRDTVSCFHPTMKRCGTCAVCYKRYIYEKYCEIKHEIYYEKGVELEDTYFQNPLENFFLNETIEKMKLAVKNKDFSRYHLQRINIYNEVLLNMGVLGKGGLI